MRSNVRTKKFIERKIVPGPVTLVANMNNKKSNDIHSTMGQRISELRNKKGISQQILADLIPCHKASVSRWENDESTPSMETISRIAEYFEVSEYYLMYGLSEQPDHILDMNGLTFYQMDIVRKLVEELRKGCR